MLKWIVGAALLAACALPAHAQNYVRITNCGDARPPAGASQGYMDSHGNVCISSAGVSNLTIVALDASSVVTGGVAISASTAGHHNRGGWLQNPPSATINLCINEQTTASGTTSAGALTCIQPGQSYSITPDATSVVSVISSDSTHPFSGQGYN